ncbi:hypothetical protein N9B63_00405 [Akkermansiaceae bacterium]|nr:hypothetical protein [Akkermansiaceae bacterium]MDA7933559.1 hypothetical protein [Akkermansiaceae bacterium]MDB4423441.1 hypothetical protein [bacterium]
MKKVILGALLLSSSASLQAQFIDFTQSVKVVFKNVPVTNSAGEIVTATQATASVTETDPATGKITAKRQTYVQVSDGSGGQETIVTQEEVVATVDPVSGAFDVKTTTEVLTTPVDVNGTPNGPTVTEETVVEEEDVEEADLALPPTTTFVPVDPELDTPIVISAE